MSHVTTAATAALICDSDSSGFIRWWDVSTRRCVHSMSAHPSAAILHIALRAPLPANCDETAVDSSSQAAGAVPRPLTSYELVRCAQSTQLPAPPVQSLSPPRAVSHLPAVSACCGDCVVLLSVLPRAALCVCGASSAIV